MLAQTVSARGNRVKFTTAITAYHIRLYPRHLDLSWDKEQESIRVSVGEPHCSQAIRLVASLPVWKRKLARLFVNPYYFRFASQIDLPVDLGGEGARVSGPAIWELMMLR